MSQVSFSPAERKILNRLYTPAKVQDYLNTLAINFETAGETCYSPRLVMRHKMAQCLEGAIFAACALSYHGHKPLLVDLTAAVPDESHVIAVFKEKGYWGAIGKTNHAVLRYREPVYETIRELVMSFFHEYFLHNGDKTLLSYSSPLDLTGFNERAWQVSEDPLWYIDKALDKIKHSPILKPWQEKQLRKADPIEIVAGKLVEWKVQGKKAKRLL